MKFIDSSFRLSRVSPYVKLARTFNRTFHPCEINGSGNGFILKETNPKVLKLGDTQLAYRYSAHR